MVKNGGYTELDTSIILAEKYIGPIEEADGYALFCGDHLVSPDELKKYIERGAVYFLENGVPGGYTLLSSVNFLNGGAINVRFVNAPSGVKEFTFYPSEPQYGFYRVFIDK